MMMALFGTIILLPIYLQNVLAQYPANRTAAVAGRSADGVDAVLAMSGACTTRSPSKLLVPGRADRVPVLVGDDAARSDHPGTQHPRGAYRDEYRLALLAHAIVYGQPVLREGQSLLHGSAVIGTIQQVSGAAGVALFVADVKRAAKLAAGEGHQTRCPEASGAAFYAVRSSGCSPWPAAYFSCASQANRQKALSFTTRRRQPAGRHRWWLRTAARDIGATNEATSVRAKRLMIEVGRWFLNSCSRRMSAIGRLPKCAPTAGHRSPESARGECC